MKDNKLNVLEIIENDLLKLNTDNINVPEVINNENMEIVTQNINSLKDIVHNFNDNEKKLKEELDFINKAKDKAQKIIVDKTSEFNIALQKYYSTPVKVVKKVGDIEVEVDELPTDKIENVDMKKKTNFKYDEGFLMLNEKYVRSKIVKTLDKNKVKKEYKEIGSIEGLEVDETIDVKLNFKENKNG